MNFRQGRVVDLLRCLGLALVFGLAAVNAQAQNTLRDIAGNVQSGAEVLRLDFTQDLKEAPTGFSIQSPARIALDFPAVTNGFGRNTLDIGQVNLRSVAIVQGGDRLRLVLNLKQATTYTTEIKGKSLFVVLDPVTGLQGAPRPSNFNESVVVDEAKPLRDVDFRRGQDSTGKIIVGLSTAQVGADIRVQGQTLVVEFLKTSLPEGLRRKLDVADFGTPVQTITTFQTGDRVRMLIEPKGNWEHNAYQTDEQFIVEVSPVKIDPAKLTPGVGFSGEKLTLNFQEIAVRSLLQVIADFTNFNIVTSDSVGGNVTLRLKDVPWDQALDTILQMRSLGLRKLGNVLWIAPKEELALKERQELEARNALQNLEPLKTQAFQLNYTKAQTIAMQLTGSAGASAAANNSRVLSPRGSVVAEPRTNQIFVTDVADKLAQVQQLIGKLDIAIRQVLIEARIVEASDTFGRSLGVRLGGVDLRGVRGGDAGYAIGNNGTRVAVGGSYDAVTATNLQSNSTLTTSNTNFLNLPAVGQGGYAPATLAFSLFGAAANRFLNLEISALEADGKGKVVSSPRVVTADQAKAVIEQGTELPYQMATASGATSIAFKKAVLRLEVTPQITPEGNIILDLDVNKDSVGQSTAQGFAVDTKHINTVAVVENGGTVVIGGIFELAENDDETKVPLLGDLPAIGNLFKSRSKSVTKKEMLVFITPKMIADKAAVR